MESQFEGSGSRDGKALFENAFKFQMAEMTMCIRMTSEKRDLVDLFGQKLKFIGC